MSPHTADRIKVLAAEGHFPKEIAKQLGLKQSEVIVVMRDGKGINAFALEEKQRQAFVCQVQQRREWFQAEWERHAPWLEREIKAWWYDWGRADWEREQREAVNFGRSFVKGAA